MERQQPACQQAAFAKLVLSYKLRTLICAEHGISIAQVSNVYTGELEKMKMKKEELPTAFKLNLELIEQELGIRIDIASFSKDFRPLIKFHRTYFINYDHPSFQSLLQNIDHFNDENIVAYLCGMLEIDFLKILDKIKKQVV